MIGKRLKELRNRDNILQQDLANALDVSKSTVAMWETDKREPDIKTILRIADYFKCSPDYIISDTLSLDFVPHEKDEAIISCPECGDEYVHFIKVKPVEFGNEKSDGIAIEFKCECGYEFYYVIETYKGNSYIIKTDKSCLIHSSEDINMETAPTPLAFNDNEEQSIIDKYHTLDEHGKKVVDSVIDIEHERSKKSK